MIEIARPSGSPPGSGCCAGRAGTAIRSLYPIRRFPVQDLSGVRTEIVFYKGGAFLPAKINVP